MDTIFFSYSRADSTFVLKLAKELRDAGENIWLDQLDIKPGSHWDASIQKALQGSKTLLIILSPNSVASENVMDEVSFALEEGKRVIPILIGNCETPFRLRRLQRIDFTGDYKSGFNSLLDALGVKPLDKPQYIEPVAEDVKKPVAPPPQAQIRKPAPVQRPAQVIVEEPKKNSKKLLMFGGGALVLILIIFGIVKLTGGDVEAKTEVQTFTENSLVSLDTNSTYFLQNLKTGTFLKIHPIIRQGNNLVMGDTAQESWQLFEFYLSQNNPHVLISVNNNMRVALNADFELVQLENSGDYNAACKFSFKKFDENIYQIHEFPGEEDVLAVDTAPTENFTGQKIHLVFNDSTQATHWRLIPIGKVDRTQTNEQLDSTPKMDTLSQIP